MSNKLIQTIKLQKVIPIIGKGTKSQITNKFNRLVSESYNLIEITLRSDEALETAIKLKEQNPNINIGIGSIKSLSVLEEVIKLKFDFYVSPGINQKMLEISKKNNIFYIPGVSTPSEILTALEYGFKILKYFHAEQNGGAQSLKVLDDIYNEILFIPTGGINKDNMKNYFNLNNVIAVGSTNI